MGHQARQQTAPLRTAQIDGPRRPDDIERAKDPKLHVHPLPRDAPAEAHPTVQSVQCTSATGTRSMSLVTQSTSTSPLTVSV
jgi:hypothetical protein